MTLLTVNTGSSSVRLSAFTPESERIAEAHYAGHAENPVGQLRAFLYEHNLCDITGIVHRIVHGGSTLTRARLIDKDVEDKIENLIPLAPLHNPPCAHLNSCLPRSVWSRLTTSRGIRYRLLRGLLGVSVSGDMRVLLDSDNAKARRACRFRRRTQRQVEQADEIEVCGDYRHVCG